MPEPSPSSNSKRTRLPIRGTVAVALGAILILIVLIAGGRALIRRVGESDATTSGSGRSTRSTRGTVARTERSTERTASTEPRTALSETLTSTHRASTETMSTEPSEAPTAEPAVSVTATSRATPIRVDLGGSRPPITEWKDPLDLVGIDPEEQAVDYEALFTEAEAYGGVAGLYRDQAEAFKGQQVYMERLEDGQPIFLKSARAKAWPASITKILTVMLLLDAVEDLDQPIEFTQEMRNGIGQTNASRAGFEPGELLTYRDLAYAAMLPSAGDATHAIAVDLAGSEAAFAEQINALAEEIGMTRSHFTNSVGLHDENQYSTAEDLAKLLRYAWQNDTFREIASTGSSATTETAQHPDGIRLRHSVLKVTEQNPEPGAYEIIGGKSGYTLAGGQAWATVVRTDDGEHYICITLGSRTPEGQLSSPAADTFRLMNGIAAWDHTADSLARP